MKKILSRILALSLMTGLVAVSGCRVSGVGGTVTHTDTTGPAGRTETTTVGGTITINRYNSSPLENGDFYVVVDLANPWQIDTATGTSSMLEITRSQNGQIATAGFDLYIDQTAVVSQIDKTTTPIVFRLSDTNAFSSFMASTGSVDGEISYQFSFPTRQVGCDISGDYLNHVRFGSGDEVVYLGAYTYRVTPNLMESCYDDIEITNASIGGKEPINDFLDDLF